MGELADRLRRARQRGLRFVRDQLPIVDRVSRRAFGNAARPTYGRMADRDRYADIAAHVATDSPVIVDGGASIGDSVAHFLSLFLSPTIHAFEPNPEAAAALERRFGDRPNVILNRTALGSANAEVELNILRHASSSSFLLPTDMVLRYHGAEMDVVQTLKVRQVRLDAVLDDDVDILKLDLQGYELEALRGCGVLLGRVRAITTEVEFVPLYAEQPLFAEIDQFLRAEGFRLLNLYELWTHPDGQLTAGDAVYLNERL